MAVSADNLVDAAAPGPLAVSPLQPPADRLDDLAQIIRAYNQVTENLQRSHEALRQQVARLQEQLASADAQLQRSKRLAALGEMAAGIAHEIRNPLGAIQLYAGLLVDDFSAGAPQAPRPRRSTRNAKPETRNATGSAETARKIAAAVRGLDAIVSDVLSFAREIAPRLAPVPASALLDRAVEAHRPALDVGGIRVVRLDGDDETLLVHADADLVHQALLNLIRNAIEAMAEKAAAGRTRTLTLAARRAGRQIVLTVRDTGPGVAADTIDRIFNPFFTTRSTGTGLGLAIVHRIIDAHGGAITMHNDGGAVFELSLPEAEPEEGRREKGEGGIAPENLRGVDGERPSVASLPSPFSLRPSSSVAAGSAL